MINEKTNFLTSIIVDGTVSGSSTMTATNFLASSDERLKTNIVPISTEPININYKQFQLKSDIGQIRYGVIGQELMKTNPELVIIDENGILSVAYIDMMIREIAYLKNKILELENKMVNFHEISIQKNEMENNIKNHEMFQLKNKVFELENKILNSEK